MALSLQDKIDYTPGDPCMLDNVRILPKKHVQLLLDRSHVPLQIDIVCDLKPTQEYYRLFVSSMLAKNNRVQLIDCEKWSEFSSIIRRGDTLETTQILI